MSTPAPADESLPSHIIRVCKNSFTKCFGVVQTTDEYAKIKYKEHLIDARKKKFGVDYLALIHANADEATKQQCIDTVLADTAAIEAEIATLKEEIARVNKATDDKIVRKPGEAAKPPPPTTASTTTAASAPAAAVEAPPAPTPAAAPAAAPMASDNVGVEVTAPTTTGMDDQTMQDVPLTTTTTTTATN